MTDLPSDVIPRTRQSATNPALQALDSRFRHRRRCRCIAIASDEEEPVEREYVAAPPAPAFQSWDEADKKSAGCVSCHTKSDRKTMHATEAVVLGCTDCHGGNATVISPTGETYSADDGKVRQWSAVVHRRDGQAHVLPRYPDHWKTSANPDPQLHVAAQGIARIRALRQSGRPARRRRSLQRLPSADRRGEQEKPDGERGDVLGRGVVQQRHLAVQTFDPRRGVHEGRPARRHRFADHARREHDRARHPAEGVSVAVVGNHAGRRHLPRVRTGRPQHRHAVSGNRFARRVRKNPAPRRTGPSRHQAVQSRLGNRQPHLDSGAEHHQDALERSRSSG